ncbi:jg1203 [Pararge aegeria aegeria]|uniref:Jg1203 protein n=1 Tax=Pararge aegeria aegeria TaxID=348720 RepID=A0A8S4R7K6_9NEOP|nr:jg1203 [Pararge aegeria aegeria]
MFLKNRYLQLMPDGTVNGTTDVSSVYTFPCRIAVGMFPFPGMRLRPGAASACNGHGMSNVMPVDITFAEAHCG